MSYLQFAENIRKATVKRYVFTINNVLAALGSKLALYRCRSSDTQFPQWHSCYFSLRPDLKVISGTKLANIEKMSNFINTVTWDLAISSILVILSNIFRSTLSWLLSFNNHSLKIPSNFAHYDTRYHDFLDFCYSKKSFPPNYFDPI